MRLKVRIGVMTALVTLWTGLFLAPVQGHPYHVTVAEAELDAKSGKLEVSLKLKPEDLERALSAMEQRKIGLEKEPKVDALILKYLKKSLRVTRGKEKAAAISWVGKQLTRKSLWLYFEVDVKGQLDGAKVEHKLLFEVLPDQMNTINFKQGKKRCSLTFSRKFSSRTVQLALPKKAKKKKN